MAGSIYLLFSRRPGGGLSGKLSDNKDFILLLGSFLFCLLLFQSPPILFAKGFKMAGSVLTLLAETWGWSVREIE